MQLNDTIIFFPKGLETLINRDSIASELEIV
jgi:hypothetical protein